MRCNYIIKQNEQCCKATIGATGNYLDDWLRRIELRIKILSGFSFEFADKKQKYLLKFDEKIYFFKSRAVVFIADWTGRDFSTLKLIDRRYSFYLKFSLFRFLFFF